MYHFTASKLRDGHPLPPIGEWLEYTGKVTLYRVGEGLWASTHPYDALYYGTGTLLHTVEVEDVECEETFRVAARRRKIIATVDAENLLRVFARWCALRVINNWQAPEIVRTYLEIGDPALRNQVAQLLKGADTMCPSESVRAMQTAWAATLLCALRAAKWTSIWGPEVFLYASGSNSEWSRASSAEGTALSRKFKEMVDNTARACYT
jgi:hypothetical protein